MNKYIYSALILFVSIIGNSQDALNMKSMAVLSGMGAEYNDIWGYDHGGDEFAVIGSNSAINIVDVNDCGNPVLINQWVDGSSVIWRDFKDYEDYIYAVCDGGACTEGLQIINKNDYTHTQSTAVFTRAHNIFVDKGSGRLYVVGSNTMSQGMHIYNIKDDPANPELLISINLKTLVGSSSTHYIHDLYVQNDTAYCSHGFPGMRIWDVKDVNNIFLISDTDATGGYNHSSWKHPSQPYMYVAEETHGKKISVYDISDITEPFTTYSFQDPLIDGLTNNLAHNPFVYLNRLYISYYHDGVQVYDVSDPELPVRIGYYDTFLNNTNYNGFEGTWGIYPFLPSGCIVAADITSGLNTLKMTIAPEAETTFPSEDIVIEDYEKGIVFITPDDEYVRVHIDSDGNLTNTTLSVAPTASLEVINSNVQFDSANIGVVMKNEIGKYFRLQIDMDGDLFVTSVNPPTNGLVLESEDLYFSQYRAGLILTDPNGVCHHVTRGDNGVEEITIIDCE